MSRAGWLPAALLALVLALGGIALALPGAPLATPAAAAGLALGLVAGAAGVHLRRARRRARQDAERARGDAEARALLDGLTDPFFVVDAEWRIRLLNEASKQRSGGRDLLGKDLWKEFPEAVGREGWVALHRAMSERVAVEYEVSYPPWQRWYRDKAYPTRDGGLAVYSQDVTDRKLAEEELRRRQEETERLLEILPVAVWIAHDAEGRVVTGNEFAERMLSIDPATNVSSQLPAGQRGWARQLRDGRELRPGEYPLQRTIATGRPLTDFEFDVERPGGTTLHLLGNTTPLFDAEGRVRGAVGTCLDVTAIRDAERRARESEERLRLAQSGGGVGVWDWSVGQDVHWSETMWALYRREPVSGREAFRVLWEEAVHPEDRARVGARVAACLAGSDTGFRDEFRISHPDGAERWLETTARIERAPDGRALRVYGVNVDVTERVEARRLVERSRDALRDSEEQFRRAIEEAPIPIVMHAEDGEVLQVSRAWSAIAGYAREDAAELRDWLAHAYGAGEPGALASAVERIAAGGGPPGPRELAFRTRAGEERHWLFSASVPGALRDGRRFVVGMAQDITERKRAEQAVRRGEALLSAVLRQLPVGFGVADPSGRWMVSNSVMDELLPVALASTLPERAARWRAWDAKGAPIPPEEWPGQRALRGEVVSGLEMILTDDDGRERWMRVSTAPFRDEAGRIVGATCIVQDIDPVKRAEEALRYSETQLALVSNTVPALISYVDSECRYRFVNQAYTEWFGMPAEAIVGRPMHEVLGDEAWRAIEPRVRAALAGETAVFETEARYAHGGARWIHAIYTPHRDAHGAVLGLVVLVSDITDRKRAEQALRDADRRKDEFLAILAHELRNPLAPIRTGLELLRIEPGTLDRVRPVMERQVAHMVHLVDDLLDVSRITSGKIRLQRQATPLAELVHNAVEANRGALDAAGLSLHLELPDVPCVLDVDPTRFVQVVSNLLHNATKFTERGGRIEVSAVVEASASGPRLALTVRDTGTGIPAETLPHVFELFVQGDAAGRGKAGLGIGLALARQLVEMHGGEIEAQSSGPGRGSAFTLRLPVVARAPHAGAREAADAPGRIARRVLVIDDNVDAADTLAALVVALGGEAQTANDGETGLRRAAAFRPDVVLLDLGMPGLDGLETCRRLRAEPFGRRAYVVALTGWGQPQDRERALAGGFDAHLTKPADPRVLEALLADVSLGRAD